MNITDEIYESPSSEMEIEMENYQYLCTLHRDAANRQRNKLWGVAIIVAIFLLIATSMSMSEFTIKKHYEYVNDLTNQSPELAKVSLEVMGIIVSGDESFNKFEDSARNYVARKNGNTPLKFMQSWKVPGRKVTAIEIYSLHKSIQELNLNEFAGKSLDSILSKRGAWGQTSIASQCISALQVPKDSFDAQRFLTLCKKEVDDIVARYQVISMYGELIDLNSKFVQLPFESTKKLKELYHSFLNLTLALGYRGFMELSLNKNFEHVRRLYSLNYNEESKTPISVSDDVKSMTVDTLYQYLTVLSNEKLKLLHEGVSASYFGISFSFPVGPFFMMVLIGTPFYFCVLSVQSYRMFKHREISVGCENALTKNYKPEHVWNGFPEPLDSRWSSTFYDPSKLFLLTYKLFLLIMYCVLLIRCFYLSKEGLLFDWLGLDDAFSNIIGLAITILFTFVSNIAFINNQKNNKSNNAENVS